MADLYLGSQFIGESRKVRFYECEIDILLRAAFLLFYKIKDLSLYPLSSSQQYVDLQAKTLPKL